MKIDIIGSLSDGIPVSIQLIESLLESDELELSHGGVFTGKPGMRIYANKQWILKINTRHAFSSESVAKKWCRIRIDMEKDFNIYHPKRCWLVVHEQRWLAVNISPRVQALNTLDFAKLDKTSRIWFITEVLRIYCQFISRFDKRLDEGLSNFGYLDGNVWYLDDDIYPWDGFLSFSAMLANWLRKSGEMCLSRDSWRQIGQQLKPLLRQYSAVADDMVYECLRDQMVGQYEGAKKELISQLRPDQQQISYLAKDEFNSGEALGVIADVHANLPALEAVLEEFEQRGIRQILMLGDVIGYGPHPAACIKKLQQLEIFCIRGNHDHYVAHNGDVKVATSTMARWAADWTILQLDADEKQWLGLLPVRYRMDDWLAVHGAPVDKSFFNAYVYEGTAAHNLEQLISAQVKICFHGHSHIQGMYVHNNKNPTFSKPDKASLADCKAVLVCPGSVGQARGGKAVAEAAVFFPDSLELEMLAVEYDVESVATDMQQLGFPDQLIERLRTAK